VILIVNEKGVIPFFCPLGLISHFITIPKIIIMELIKQHLENALNETYLMRGLNSGDGWCRVGTFFIGEKKYAFYGTTRDAKVTCRCMDNAGYANHWFEMKTEYIGDMSVVVLGECIG